MIADVVSPSPLFDLFRRGDVPREVRLLAAQGVMAPRAGEQLSILVLLASDRDDEVCAEAAATIDLLPRPSLEAFLGRADAAADVRAYFEARGIRAARPGSDAAEVAPLVDFGSDLDLGGLELELQELLAGGSADAADGEPDDDRKRPISTLAVIDKMKLAMRGTREQRAVLVRDSNRLVSTAVLSSPKVTDSEVETFARMANVSEDVLRIIAANRTWTKSYVVASALARNPKTPPAVSMPLVARLNERDLKMLSIDRNAPEGLRITARKLLTTNESRRR